MPEPDESATTHRVHDGVEVPTRGARTWAVVGGLLAVAGVWIPLLGVVGMVAGSVSHLKGDRWGMPAAVMAVVGTVVGMALVFFTRLT